jgi:hypothetical protein
MSGGRGLVGLLLGVLVPLLELGPLKSNRMRCAGNIRDDVIAPIQAQYMPWKR